MQHYLKKWSVCLVFIYLEVKQCLCIWVDAHLDFPFTHCLFLTKSLNPSCTVGKKGGCLFQSSAFCASAVRQQQLLVAWDDSVYETILAPHSRCDISSANRVTDESDFFFFLYFSQTTIKVNSHWYCYWTSVPGSVRMTLETIFSKPYH